MSKEPRYTERNGIKALMESIFRILGPNAVISLRLLRSRNTTLQVDVVSQWEIPERVLMENCALTIDSVEVESSVAGKRVERGSGWRERRARS